MQAMIFAAGLGTRLKPVTDKMPKALVRVCGEPLLSRVVNKLKDAGTDRIVVNVHHFSGQIKSYLRDHDNFNMDIRVSDETEMLLDTGGGIKKAMPLFSPDYPILIHNVDILSDVDLRAFYNSCGGADALLLVSSRKTRRYLLFNDDMRLVGWTNTGTGEIRTPYPDLRPEDCRMFAFSGIHTFSPRLFGLLSSFGDKFGIIDFYLSVCDKAVIKGYVKDGLRIMDVGKTDTLSDAEEFVNTVLEKKK